MREKFTISTTQIYMEETARGCSQEGLNRVQLSPGRTGLAAKYGLKLVSVDQ